MSLSYEQAREFYDSFGSWQDHQIYERSAIKALIEKSRFATAHDIFEFGCGTGALAAQLLSDHLPDDARYEGVDVSSTMISLSEQRLVSFGQRARVNQTDGSVQLRREDASCDRFISCYVFDLLSESDAESLLEDARRILVPGGLICLISLTYGRTAFSRLVESTWSFLYRRKPTLVGGCRPISLSRLVRTADWQNIDLSVVTTLGICSEVLVARKV